MLSLLVCFVLSFPIGVLAAVYLEMFAPRNRINDLIHQIVYEALKAEMGGKLHALALQTGVPES
jgi:stress-induced morphogen